MDSIDLVGTVGGEAVHGDACCGGLEAVRWLGGLVWNLGYRLAADVHGHGYATELRSEAMRQAHGVDPSLPVVASLLEHNTASERVAVKLGMKLVYQAPDTGIPDASAVRLVYADRPLCAADLSVVVG